MSNIIFKWNGQDFPDSTYSAIFDNKNTIVIGEIPVIDGFYNINIDNLGEYNNQYSYNYNNYNTYKLHVTYNTYEIKSNEATIYIGDSKWDITNLINEDNKIIFIDGDCTYQDGILTSKFDDNINFKQDDIKYRPDLKTDNIKYFSFNKNKYLELSDPTILADKSSISIFAIVRLKKYDNTNIKANPIFNIDKTLDLAVSSKSINKVTLHSHLNDSNGAINNTFMYINEWIMIYAGVDYENNRSIIYTNGGLDNTIDDIFDSSSYSAENVISSFIGKDNNNNYFNGDIASLIIFPNQYFGDTNISRIFGWAAHNYNLTHKLIDSHNYKFEYPTLLNMYDVEVYYSDILKGVLIKWYTDYTEEVITIYRDDMLLYEGSVGKLSFIDDSVYLGDFAQYNIFFQNSLIYSSHIFIGKIWTPLYYNDHALYLSGNNILLESNKITTAYDYINDFDFIQTNISNRPKKEVLELGYDGNTVEHVEQSEAEFTNDHLNEINAITFNKSQWLENSTYIYNIDKTKPLSICLYKSHPYIYNNNEPAPMSTLSVDDVIEDESENTYVDYIKYNSYLNIGDRIYFIKNECYIINENNEILSTIKVSNFDYEKFNMIVFTFDFSNNNILTKYITEYDDEDHYTSYLNNDFTFNNTIYLGQNDIRIAELLILNSGEDIFKFADNLNYRLGEKLNPTIFTGLNNLNIIPNNNNFNECIITWTTDYNLPTKIYSRGLNDTDLTYLGTATALKNSFNAVANTITIFDIEHNNENYDIPYYPYIKSNDNEILNLRYSTGFKNNAPDIHGGKILKNGLMVNSNYNYYDERFYIDELDVTNIYYLGNLYSSNFCLEICTISNNISRPIIIKANNNNKITIEPTSIYSNNMSVPALKIIFGEDELSYEIQLLLNTYHIMLLKIENGFKIYANGLYMGSATTENPIYFDETYIEHTNYYFKSFKISKECPYNITTKFLPSYNVVDMYLYNVDYIKTDNNLDIKVDINLDNQYLYKIVYSEDNFVNSNVIISEGIYNDTLNINATITDDTLERVYIKTIVLDAYGQEINSNIKILMLKNVNFNIISVPFGPGGPPQ